MIDSTTLSLTLQPLRPGEWIANTPPRIGFRVGQAPAQERQARGDYRPTNDLFNALQGVAVGGDSVLDVVADRGASLWQFLPSYIWPAVFRAVELAAVLSAVIDECRPAAIRCAPVDDETHDIWVGVVSALAARRRIPVEVLTTGRSLGGRGRALVRRTGLGLRRAGWRETRARVRLAAAWSRSEPSEARVRQGRTLLWAARARDWVRQPGSTRCSDEHLYPMLPALRTAGWQTVVGVECPYGDPRVVAERFASRLRQRDPGIRWRPYFRPGDGSGEAARRARAVLAAAWARLDRDAGFRQALQHAGAPLWPALAATFRRAFLHALPDCAGQLAAASAILADERPDAVMAVYENGPFARALIIEAGRRGIPTLGLQHGTIFPNHYDYMHTGIVQASSGARGFVVPDATCVWGPAWRETLVAAGHYPPESVVVTGAWRYDNLRQQTDALDTREVRERLGVPPGVGVAAILSSGQGTVEYVAAALDAVQSRTDVVPLVRLHPSDDPAPVRKELQRRGLPERVMPAVGLLELLSLSRVVISQWSTVVAEAALAGRPVVLVNLLGLPGAEAYLEAGICVPANTADGIGAALARVLDDEATRARLDVARARFIERFFHRIDGRASARVAGVLEGLVARGASAASSAARASE